MSNPSIPDSQPTAEPDESFGELLSQFEQSHSRKAEDGSRQIEGTVIAVSAESVFLDIGFKSEGILPLAAFQSAGEEVKPGDKLTVSVKGRDPDGYYELSRFKTAVPKDWSALERAFADKSTIMGTVTGVIKGGLSVDVGSASVYARFAQRSARRRRDGEAGGAGDPLPHYQARRDRRRRGGGPPRRDGRGRAQRARSAAIRRSRKARRCMARSAVSPITALSSTLAEWTACCTSATSPGAALPNPADVLSVGQEIEARVLKIDPEKRRISLGLKQIQPDPVAFGGRKIQSRRARARHGDARGRLRSVCRTGARGRRLDPPFGDVVGQEGEAGQRRGEAGRSR